MSIKPALFSKPALFTVAASLVVGLSGCGSAQDTPGTTTPKAAPTSSPTLSPTSSPTSSPSVTAAAKGTSPSAKAGKSSAAAAPTVTIKNFQYKVAMSVAPGAKVVVVNNDNEAHTVTSAQKGAFDVKVFGGGAKATFKAPAKPGTYPFTCQFHAGMNGKLVVS